MAKGRGKMRMGSGGGMFGSGVFGMFGTTIRCDAESNSLYCNFMKLVNILMVLAILYFFYYMFFKGKR